MSGWRLVDPGRGSGPRQAPELVVSRWFNTGEDLTLEALRGQVVVLEAFQMLCPGCVSHGLPQAQRIQAVFGRDVRVIGLHTVFEHHEAMTPVSLAAFLHEYRISFPVGVDTHDRPGGMPVTFTSYGMQGTPTIVLIDRAGRTRFSMLGRVEDVALGAAIGQLIDEDQTGNQGG